MVVADDEADLQTIGGVAPKEGEAIIAVTIAVTTAIKGRRRRRRQLVYSCGEIELLPPCTEEHPL